MIRKPTRIELKQEDDSSEYEDYKRKQAEQIKLNKLTSDPVTMMKNTTDKFLSDLTTSITRSQQSGLRNQDFGMNLFFNNQARDMQSDIGNNYINNVFRNTQQTNNSQDQIDFDIGSDTINNNFIFSVLLNNISQSGNPNMGLNNPGSRGPNMGPNPPGQ